MEHKAEREDVSVTPGLFESTEGRGPLAPPGSAFVWGVDVSSKRVSIAVESQDVLVYRVAPDEEPAASMCAVFTKAFTRPRSRANGERLAIIFAETLEFASALAGRYFPVDQVSVESPAMNPHGGSEPILEYTTGVVVAALSEALRVPVWMVPVKRWKARALGNGNVDKAETLRWARAEFGATIEDEADAAGVCRAAKLTVWGGLCDEKDVKRGAVPRA